MESIDASELARVQAEDSGVSIKELHEPEEMMIAANLLARVWGVDPSKPQIHPGLMVALSHAGNYVTGAFDGEQMVGVGIGFFHTPRDNSLHSHIAGVLGTRSGSGIGKALKFHQRAWCLQRGIDTITWTYDPLVARNAFFNFERIGVRATRYIPNCYGTIDDELNRNEASDRLMVKWDLHNTTELPLNEAAESSVTALRRSKTGPVIELPVDQGTRICHVEIPTDIEKLRRENPSAAGAWRMALRNTLIPLMADGWQIAGFDRSGFYRMERY